MVKVKVAVGVILIVLLLAVAPAIVILTYDNAMVANADGESGAAVVITADNPGGNGTDNGAPDSFRLVRNGLEVVCYIDGNFSQSLALSSIDTITVEGSGDDDTLTVDFSQGDPVPPGGLTFNGQGNGSGGDAMEILGGSQSSVWYEYTSLIGGAIHIDGSVIYFTGLEPVLDLVPGLSLTVYDWNGPIVGSHNINYGVGSVPTNCLITIDGEGWTAESIEFSNKTRLTLYAEDGNDTVTLDNTSVPTSLTTITVNGGLGDDVIDSLNVGTGLPGPVNLNGDEGDDVFHIYPSTSATFNINGGTHVDGDTLVVYAQGYEAWDTGTAIIFYDDAFETINYSNIETVCILDSAVPTITGVKFEDMNGDGVKDVGDPGIPGWTINLNGNNVLGDAVTLSTFTGSDGSYGFAVPPGTYTITEDLEPGWTQTYPDIPGDGDWDIVLPSGQVVEDVDFGNYQDATISGVKFEDLNGNGVKNGGEPGLSGWTIRLEGTDGLGNPVSLITSTGGDGSYSFDVPPGNYIIIEELEPDWTQTYPYVLGQEYWDIMPTSGEAITDKDFGNYQDATIGGVKFEDLNGNGVKNGGEPGLPGWTIRLEGYSSLGDYISLITPTDSGGSYSFDVPPGNYIITEYLMSGWTQTYPDIPGDGDWDVIAVSGQILTNRDFGNYYDALIYGMKFEDLNGNGVKDGGEPGLPGWTIRLAGYDGLGDYISLIIPTDSGGSYSFTVPPGNYIITEDLEPDWTQTYPDISGDGDWDVMVISEQILADRDFGNYQDATISGVKFRDLNRDGFKDGGEPGLPGWTIRLNGTDGLGNPVSLSTSTGGDGSYSFDVPPGTYTIREDLKPGWAQTCPDIPGDGDWDVTVVSGQLLINRDFGNYSYADLSVTKSDSPDPVIAGTDLTYTIIASNSSPESATGVVVTDTLPAGVTYKSETHSTGNINIAGGVVTWDGFGLANGVPATLTLTVRVNAPAIDGMVLTNTAQVYGDQFDPDLTNNEASEETTVFAPNVHDPKTVTLEIDADGDGAASPGDTLRYSNVIINDGNGTAFGVIFSDVPDANTTLVAGSVTTTQGYVSKGNFQGDERVEVSLGDMPGHSQATVTFAVTINKPLWEPRIANQAMVTGGNFTDVKSDDPGTGGSNDPTVININTSPSLPGVTFWGGMALVVILGMAMVWVLRRRQIHSGAH